MIGIRKAGFKHLPPLALVGLCVLALTACDDGRKAGWNRDRAAAAPTDSAEAASYLKPPRALSARLDGVGVVLQGEAAPLTSVRLGAPTGEAVSATADAAGRWSLTVPAGVEVQLYGLSMTGQGRTVQAEGYLMITPQGRAALLRAGAGAYVLSEGSASPRLLAIDYDLGGGAVISGVATPGAGLGVRVDRASRAEGKVDEEGRFVLSLSQPLASGSRVIQVAGEGGEQQIVVQVAPAQPLTRGPVRSVRTAVGWRVDWMTPGGGVQTTQIIEGPAPGQAPS